MATLAPSTRPHCAPSLAGPLASPETGAASTCSPPARGCRQRQNPRHRLPQASGTSVTTKNFVQHTAARERRAMHSAHVAIMFPIDHGHSAAAMPPIPQTAGKTFPWNNTNIFKDNHGPEDGFVHPP